MMLIISIPAHDVNAVETPAPNSDHVSGEEHSLPPLAPS